MQRRTAWIPWLLLPFVLCDVTGLQFTPVALTGAGDGDCALLLNGPGRSSSFDYNLNVLRGGNGFGYNGPHTCITYDAVNAAYLEARKRVQVAQPHGDYKAEDVATVGELLLDISVNLARTYGLSYEDIEKGLPLIDTSKTLIREVCPPFLSNVECRPGKYRRFDGLCTNLENPTWGSTMQPFTRLIGPLYADGMNAPRISVTGNQLPLARVVSRTMHPDDGFHDHAGTVMVIAWGQFIDHDYTLTGTPLDPLNRNDPEECCKRPPHLKNPYCNEIPIPEDDYFYRLFNVRCIDFVRGFPAARPGCRLGSRSQFNTLTGVLDANTVYGVTEKFARKLRSGYGGQLRMNPVFREYGLKDLLPLKLDIPDEGCTRPNRSMYCFEAGEIRVNEQLVLTCMHTLMAREHNRVAEGLAQVNPHWDDETLFQEARRINIAEVQHITYNEFLPILLGKEVMEKFGLLLQKDGYWDGYDPSVNPNVIDAFAAAAYRFGHSLLPTAVERWSKAHKFIASKRLSDLIRRPYDLYRAGVFDEYFMGLMNQVAQAMDDSITQEVTNHLFKKVGARFGMDLVSFNMQRGREFGLPGYMEFRKFCGLPGADTFDELFGSMPNETIKRYSSIFEHPHDVDLWSGGVSERPLPGSMLGPTFACIIATQFSYSRRGDRFWYELPHQPSSFTPEQLKEIKKSRMARVICDNTDLIDSIQLYPMVLPDHEINPRVPCRSGVLPSIDFTKWADHGSPHFQQQHQQQQFTSNNLVESTDVHPKILSIAKYALHKKILESNLNGKHPYASLFKTQPNNKKPLLKPALVTKEVITIHRSKRSLENITELIRNSTIQNTTEFEAQENGTISPLIDQVTEAITVTEVSGTPPPKPKLNNGPLNYQPFIITSSDFQNTTDSQNFEDLDSKFVDVGKLIQEKLQQISEPEDGKENEEADNLEEEDEEIQNEEQRTEDYDDNEEIVDEDTEKDEEETEKLVIYVPESSKEDKEEIQEETSEEQLNEDTQNLPEETPDIPESFAKHFVEMGAIEPELKTQESKTQNEKGNLQINGEKFYLPLKVDSSEESNEEIKEKNKYFDDIMNYQLEQNQKLQQELEYPDLDNEYEKYKQNSEKYYSGNKESHYAAIDKPYVINLDGIFPYEERLENEEEEERDYKDDVDTGTDKERLELEQEKEEYNEEEDDEDDKENIQQEEYKEEIEERDEEQPKDESANEELVEYDEDPEEIEEKVPTEKKVTVIPVAPKQGQNIPKDSQIDESNIQKLEVVTTENILEALNKIMKQRDAISRQQQIKNPKDYNTYWSLEYKMPNPK